MLDSLFAGLTMALSQSYLVALAASFTWGILSVLLSPCHLSGIPLVIGYISSNGRIKAQRTLFLSLLFAAGSLFTITVLGIITASMGRMLGDTGKVGSYVIAGVFIMMGLYLLEIIKLKWNGIALADEQRGGLWGAFLLGLLFGIGLGPCTFAFLAPVLGVVFNMASENWLKAVLLIGAFGIAHATVMAFAGSMITLVQHYLDWSGKSIVMISIKRGTGLLLLITGFYFAANLVMGN
ncbi:MAG: cytochrome c biogenesis protein CcdA [Chlorobiaceae bacterium]